MSLTTVPVIYITVPTISNTILYPNSCTSTNNQSHMVQVPYNYLEMIKNISLTHEGDSAKVFLPDGSYVEVFGDGTVDRYINNYPDVIRHIDVINGAHLKLPDGATVRVHKDGQIEILDAQAKILYKPPPLREFNPYLSSSDLVEEFIKYCGSLGIKSKEFTELPLNLYLYWLIVRAAEQDKDDANDVKILLTTSVKKVQEQHRCKSCGRFIKQKLKEVSIFFCSPGHMNRQLTKIG